jgi:hypothetical protein
MKMLKAVSFALGAVALGAAAMSASAADIAAGKALVERVDAWPATARI